MNAPAKRNALAIVGIVGTVLIASGAFLLSYSALTDLAAAAGIHPGMTWIWPLIVDGLIVVSTIGAVALAGCKGVAYCWTLLIGASILSITANAIHASMYSTRVAPWLASMVAAIPPLVLLAVTHLTVVISRRQPSNEIAAVPRVSRDRATAARRPSGTAAATAVPEPSVVSPVRDSSTADRTPSVNARDFVIAYLLAQGGKALASQVTQAGRDAGFAPDTVRVARRRCQPPVASVGTPDGWMWTISDTGELELTT